MLRNRNNFPPGGFPYFQAETGWSATLYIGFDAVVSEIIAHRRANPRFKLPTDKATVEHELEQYTVARLQSIPGGQAYLIEGSPAPPPGSFTPPPQRRPVARAVANKVDQIKTGVGTLLGWLGSGLKPVDAALAEKRASICVSCPLNKPSSMFSLSPAIGDAVKLMMQAKAELRLSTSHDAKLETCEACLCRTATKVWVPIGYIWKNMKPEVAAALDLGCWIGLEDRS